jgi:broad specificity phosphatase PhoE
MGTELNRPTIIHFVRHGHADGRGIYYGRLSGYHLSPLGLAQAGAAAASLKDRPIGFIYSSPLERTWETAQVIAGRLDLPLQRSDLLLEVHSPFDGQPVEVMEARDWDIYAGSKPPFEQPVDVLNRGHAFIQDARTRHAGEEVVAVTHAGLITLLAVWALQLPIQSPPGGDRSSYFPGNATISSFTFHTATPSEIPGYKYDPLLP